MENYKESDKEKIVDFLRGRESVAVNDIIASSGADKMRVFVILFELEQEGAIEVEQRDQLGAPERVILK